MMRYLWRRFSLTALILSSFIVPVFAGTLAKEDLDKLFEDHYIVGEIQADLPVYPLFFKNPDAPDSKPELKAYVFESNDLVSVRGYSGKPINILVVIDLHGNFLSARLLDHKEPIFIDPYGHSKLAEFAAQYKGLTLRHTIDILKSTETPSRNEHTALLRGVNRGTITVKAMNRTIMTAAAKVALVKLKIAVAPGLDSRTTEKDSTGQDSAAETRPGLEPHADTKPAEPNASEAVKPATAPLVTENAVAPENANSSRATTVLSQSESTGALSKADSKADRGVPGEPQPEASSSMLSGADIALTSAVLADDQSAREEWIRLWQSRATEIAILLIALGLLVAGLVAQRRISSDHRRLRWLRVAYLLFTLGFVGWFAQGQLTIVNITASLESLRSGGDLSFLMNDPITVILWLFVGVTLLVWGRGTFCGWLCPFGALQELISLLSNAIGVRQRRLRTVLDRKLKWLKYGILASLLGALFVAPGFTETAVEIEPFKTAISFYFQRDWPYVAWAVACLAFGVVIYRGYCRYLCPLGAALASVNFLQRWSWIPRREACGAPCQSCRHRCEYQAITPTGKISYQECFQCLDCVSIYQDDTRCLPLIRQKKIPTMIPVYPVLENRI